MEDKPVTSVELRRTRPIWANSDDNQYTQAHLRTEEDMSCSPSLSAITHGIKGLNCDVGEDLESPLTKGDQTSQSKGNQLCISHCEGLILQS